MIYNFLSYATFLLIVSKKCLESNSMRHFAGTKSAQWPCCTNEKTVRKHFLNCADCMILSVYSKSRCCGYHTSTVVPCRGSLRSNVSPGLATCQQSNVFLHIHFIPRAAIRPIFIHPEITLETFPSLILQLRMTFVIGFGHKKLIIQKCK